MKRRKKTSSQTIPLKLLFKEKQKIYTLLIISKGIFLKAFLCNRGNFIISFWESRIYVFEMEKRLKSNITLFDILYVYNTLLVRGLKIKMKIRRNETLYHNNEIFEEVELFVFFQRNENKFKLNINLDYSLETKKHSILQMNGITF